MNRYIAQITQSTNLSTQEAWWLLEHITQLPQTSLIVETKLSQTQAQQLNLYIDQISKEHKPLAYIIGWVPFLDLKLLTQPPILIPRPETEEWVYQLISELKTKSSQIRRILDVGTGSGPIALALAQSFPLAQITALDVNPAALALAQKNAVINKIANITFIQSDLFTQIPSGTQFDLIVSNPPYIDPKEKITMQQTVTAWEDPSALFSDDQGMALIKQIMHQSGSYIAPNAQLPYQLVIEFDRSQQDLVSQVATQAGLQCMTRRDSFGHWRTTWCKLT